MSDSSCSNCEKDSCKYRDYSYNCYKTTVDIVQSNFTKEEIETIAKLNIKLNSLYDTTYQEIFDQASFHLQAIIDCSEGK
jgi:hypothetical protein